MYHVTCNKSKHTYILMPWHGEHLAYETCVSTVAVLESCCLELFLGSINEYNSAE